MPGCSRYGSTPRTLCVSAPVRVLPAIAVAHRDGQPNAAGLAAAREIVRRRVPDDALDELFGAAHREDRVRALAEATGGVIGDMLRILQGFVARDATDERAFAREVSIGLEVYRRMIWESDHEWLARVHETRALQPANDGAADAAARSLANGAVIAHDGDAPWWDVHPAVRAVLDEARALRGGGS